MHWKSGLAGGVIIGVFAVISYVNSTPTPEAGVVIGMIGASALAVLAVLLVALYARRSGTRS